MNKEKYIITKFLIKRGWSTWYNPNYWVHPKTVNDTLKQDYTNYGMDLLSAFVHEVENISPELLNYSINLNFLVDGEEKDILKYYFDDFEK